MLFIHDRPMEVVVALFAVRTEGDVKRVELIELV